MQENQSSRSSFDYCCAPRSNDLDEGVQIGSGSLSDISSKMQLLLESSQDVRASQKKVTSALANVGKQLQITAKVMADAQNGESLGVDVFPETPGGETTLNSKGGVTTDVEIMMTIERLVDVDTVNQQFKVGALVQYQWLCPRSETPPPPHKDDGDWVPDFNPKFRFKNVVEEVMSTTNFSVKLIGGLNYVLGTTRWFGTISQPLNLHSFPSDNQDLVITIESLLLTQRVNWRPMWTYLEDGSMKAKPIGRLLKDRCSLSDFDMLHEQPFTANMCTGRLPKGDVSQLWITVKVTRKSSYYLSNVALICFCLVSLVFTSWGLHPGDPGDRLDVDFNIILTVVAFKLILADMLPAVAYLTRLDLYVLVGFCFLLFVTFVHSIFDYLFYTKAEVSDMTREPEYLPKEVSFNDWDMYTCYSFGGFWTVWNVGYFFYCWSMSRREYQKFKEDAIAKQLKYDQQDDEIIFQVSASRKHSHKKHS